MKNNALFNSSLEEHIDVLRKTKSLDKLTLDLADLLLQQVQSGGKIYLCGNGGSAADCQHFATELTVRFEKKPARIRCSGFDYRYIRAHCDFE